MWMRKEEGKQNWQAEETASSKLSGIEKRLQTHPVGLLLGELELKYQAI